MSENERWTIRYEPQRGRPIVWNCPSFWRDADEVEVVPASRLQEAEEALRECARLSGADLSDGFPTWPPLHEFAVEQVRQLRDDYDAALGEATGQQDSAGEGPSPSVPAGGSSRVSQRGLDGSARLVTTPHDDPIVQACVDHGGHFWPADAPEDEPPTCTRCWFNPGWKAGKSIPSADLKPIRDEPQA